MCSSDLSIQVLPKAGRRHARPLNSGRIRAAIRHVLFTIFKMTLNTYYLALKWLNRLRGENERDLPIIVPTITETPPSRLIWRFMCTVVDPRSGGLFCIVVAPYPSPFENVIGAGVLEMRVSPLLTPLVCFSEFLTAIESGNGNESGAIRNVCVNVKCRRGLDLP